MHLPIPLMKRNSRSLALEIPGSAPVTVGNLLLIAQEIANKINSIWPNRIEAGGPCLIISSKNPIIFTAGLLGCCMAGATAACWEEDTFPSKEFASLVSASGVLYSKCLTGTCFEIESLVNLSWLKQHPGNLIVATSGSTGSPKGVSLSIEGVALNAFLAGTHLGLTALEGWAIETSFSLMSAINHFFMAWQFDLPLVYLKAADKQTKDLFFSKKRLGFGGAPLQLKRQVEERSDSAAPSCFVSSGDFLSESIISQLYNRFPDSTLHSFYGLTEVSGRFCHIPIVKKGFDKEKRATGVPLPGFSVKFKGQEGGISHNPAEIFLKTPLLCNGYYRQDKTFCSILPGSWFATGDLGTVDSAGAIYLQGRMSDVFKVSGEKVDRISIEEKLLALFPLNVFCVLPVDHPLIGKCPALFVEADDTEVLPSWRDIIIHLKCQLPSRYIPVYCYRLKKLYRLKNGKLNKQKLISQHESFQRLQ